MYFKVPGFFSQFAVLERKENLQCFSTYLILGWLVPQINQKHCGPILNVAWDGKTAVLKFADELGLERVHDWWIDNAKAKDMEWHWE